MCIYKLIVYVCSINLRLKIELTMKKTTEIQKMVCINHTKTQCSPKELFELANDELKVKFRDAYMLYTGMTYSTFYYKVRNNSFRPLEEKAFYEVLANNPLA